MAKSPRKVASAKQRPPKVHAGAKAPSVGGKNFRAYNLPANYGRRFSIADSSSSESEGSKTRQKRAGSASDSDSSLTAVSDNEEASRKGSFLLANDTRQKRTLAKKKTYSAKKRHPKKTVSWSQWAEEAVELASDDDDDEEEQDIGLGGIYSMMNQLHNSTDDSEDDDDDDEDDEQEFLSSDDSDIDFVQLQAERKARSMKLLRAMKGLPRPQEADEDSGLDVALSEQSTPKKSSKRRRSSSVPKQKFGRRKSEVALPEDINFTFEFGDLNKGGSAIADDDEEDETTPLRLAGGSLEPSEEDIGEEINGEDGGVEVEFDFETPLLEVPKIRDDELNLDEDYEFDDNELLATLQHDNDIDDFTTRSEVPRTRTSSVGSFNDDEENDPFLKEEEKFLVNEFENNGFDDDFTGNDGFSVAEEDRTNLIDSFHSASGHETQPVVQYASSVDSKSDDDDDEDETSEDDYDDDYDDFIDFSMPFMEKSNTPSDDDRKKPPKKSARKHHKGTLAINSDDDDDLYLWNYFFSSDNESQDELGLGQYDMEEQMMLERLFEQQMEDKRPGKRARHFRKKLVSVPQVSFSPEDGYDSGESTDVDLTLPETSKTSKVGSKLAKEVLSSKTADYRPPVLGTWVAVESRPFSIIDGLSTRTLNSANRHLEARLRPRKSVVGSYANSDDLALGLDELLNISELDNDDENDVRIWRDFNNRKKQVPLGAFRNKSILHNPGLHTDEIPVNYNHTSRLNNEFNQRRYLLTNHTSGRRGSIKSEKKGAPGNRKPSISESSDQPKSKFKRRKASIVEAVSEGFRPTKSGLFSENALADVEEVLGDDNDIMALIKGL